MILIDESGSWREVSCFSNLAGEPIKEIELSFDEVYEIGRAKKLYERIAELRTRLSKDGKITLVQ